MRSFNEIAAEYAPYHTMPAFQLGAEAYMDGDFVNPFDGRPADGVKAQAWDRGRNAAMLYTRQARGA